MSDAREPTEPVPLPGAPPPPALDAGTRISTGRSLALGCGGVLAFFVLAGVVATFAGLMGWFVLAPLALLALVAVRGARRATPGGRARLARFAVGFALGVVLFGGCLVLVTNADFR